MIGRRPIEAGSARDLRREGTIRGDVLSSREVGRGGSDFGSRAHGPPQEGSGASENVLGLAARAGLSSKARGYAMKIDSAEMLQLKEHWTGAARGGNARLD